MAKIKSIIKIFLLSSAITLAVFYKIPAKGLIPFPGNLLVGRFFPFNTMSWEGYPAGVPYKEFINADVVRQLYPWRELGVDEIKKGNFPWWNPYAFSGNPLLANVQSAPFYPLNLMYWILTSKQAWILGVLLQPILAFSFMWLFARELNLSRWASLFASTAFSFSGYLMVFWELNTVGHAALWLPLILWGIEKRFKTGGGRFALPVAFGLASSLLAGHLQTTMYLSMVTVSFFVFRLKRESKDAKKKLSFFAVSVFLAFIIAAPQIIPSLRFTPFTVRGTQASEEIFGHFTLPFKYLVTFIAHDYFGNPAAGNFWGVDYGEFMGFFGVVALLMALISLSGKKKPEIKFFLLLALTALLFALHPLASVLRILKIPILSTSAPSRMLFIVQFSGSILAGFGVEKWLKGKVRPKPAVRFLALGFGLAWAIAIFGYLKSTDPTSIANWKVTTRNLVLPTAVFAAASIALLSANSFIEKILKLAFLKTSLKKIIILSIFALSVLEYSYFANKFQTFSQPRFFFPEAPIFEFVKQRSDPHPYRFFGDYTASVTSNSWIPYDIYSVEGYDSLYIKRYGELLAASRDGKLPNKVPRSDANLVKNQDDTRRRRLQDLMGVKYILDKNDNPPSNWDPEPHRFPPDRYRLIWQEGKFKAYENLQALPRAFLVELYIVETDPQKSLDLIFNPDFDLETTLILEEEIVNSALRSSSRIYDSKPKLLSFLNRNSEEQVQNDGKQADIAQSDRNQGDIAQNDRNQGYIVLNDRDRGQSDIEEISEKVEFVSYSPNKVEIKVKTPNPQLLFLSDAFYPDWKAEIDGEESKIYRADYAFRALAVPAGEHQVIFEYKPNLLNPNP